MDNAHVKSMQLKGLKRQYCILMQFKGFKWAMYLQLRLIFAKIFWQQNGLVAKTRLFPLLQIIMRHFRLLVYSDAKLIYTVQCTTRLFALTTFLQEKLIFLSVTC